MTAMLSTPRVFLLCSALSLSGPSSLPHASQHTPPLLHLPHLLAQALSPSSFPPPPVLFSSFTSSWEGFSLPEFKLPAWVGDYPISSMNPATSMSVSCHHKESWVLICSPVVPPAAHLAGGRAEGELLLQVSFTFSVSESRFGTENLTVTPRDEAGDCSFWPAAASSCS